MDTVTKVRASVNGTDGHANRVEAFDPAGPAGLAPKIPPAGHPLDAALAAARAVADHYHPGGRAWVVVAPPGGGPASRFEAPPADAFAAPAGSSVVPVKCPGCAAAVLRLLARTGTPMTMPAVHDALAEAGEGYAETTISITLAWLTGTNVLVNPVGGRPRGYRFNTGD